MGFLPHTNVWTPRGFFKPLRQLTRWGRARPGQIRAEHGIGERGVALFISPLFKGKNKAALPGSPHGYIPQSVVTAGQAHQTGHLIRSPLRAGGTVRASESKVKGSLRASHAFPKALGFCSSSNSPASFVASGLFRGWV